MVRKRIPVHQTYITVINTKSTAMKNHMNVNLAALCEFLEGEFDPCGDTEVEAYANLNINAFCARKLSCRIKRSVLNIFAKIGLVGHGSDRMDKNPVTYSSSEGENTEDEDEDETEIEFSPRGTGKK